MKKMRSQNKIKEWITNKLQGLVYRLDNTGRGELETNGEVNLIKMLGKIYEDNTHFTFFDVGANRGDYSELVLKYIHCKNLNIHIFEPQKTCIEILKSKFKCEKLITVNDFGLSDKTETTKLYKDFDQSGLASVYNRNLSHYNIKIDASEEANFQRADKYIAEKYIQTIDLVKIDVEGHELKVLEGFGDFVSIDKIGLVQFEYGGANLDSHTSLLELYTYFEKRGFIMCKIMNKHLEIRKYHPRLENFMYANYVAVSPKFIEIYEKLFK